MWKPAKPLSLTLDQRSTLMKWVRGRSTAQKMVLRARIVLMAADGCANHAMAQALETNRKTVQLWRNRFAQGGLEALSDEARSGRKPTFSQEFVERVIHITTQEKPPAATHWSTRSLAQEVGLSQSAIVRIWHSFGLQPHRNEKFKLSTDPFLVEKIRDITGLYLNPPEHAIVLSIDEKSQVQALDRTQPILPLRPRLPEQRTSDYERHGTTSLFAAFHIATGQVNGGHRHLSRAIRSEAIANPSRIWLGAILITEANAAAPAR